MHDDDKNDDDDHDHALHLKKHVKVGLWHERPSKSCFSDRNNPEWYRKIRFSMDGDLFYDICPNL